MYLILYREDGTIIDRDDNIEDYFAAEHDDDSDYLVDFIESRVKAELKTKFKDFYY